MEKLNKHSLRVSIIIYFCGALLIAQLIYSLLGVLIDQILIDQITPRPDKLFFSGKTYIGVFIGNKESSYNFQLTNPKLFWGLKGIKDCAPIWIYGACIVGGALIFYKRRLERPLKQLNEGMEKIARQDLDFCIATKNEDEIGELCNAFEKMRIELSTAFKSLWREKEQQEILFKTLIHDLRTPLTIIEGNNEVASILLEQSGETQKIRESLNLSREAVERIKSYTATLQKMKDIEDWQIHKQVVCVENLKEKVERVYSVLARTKGINLCVTCMKGQCEVDEEMVELILDKVLENAIRFAKSEVRIRLQEEGNRLRLVIEDDGDGFSSEALNKAMDVFYSQDKGRGHIGMGLTIVRNVIQCAKGSIELENREEGGARIKILI